MKIQGTSSTHKMLHPRDAISSNVKEKRKRNLKTKDADDEISKMNHYSTGMRYIPRGCK